MLSSFKKLASSSSIWLPKHRALFSSSRSPFVLPISHTWQRATTSDEGSFFYKMATFGALAAMWMFSDDTSTFCDKSLFISFFLLFFVLFIFQLYSFFSIHQKSKYPKTTSLSFQATLILNWVDPYRMSQTFLWGKSRLISLLTPFSLSLFSFFRLY